LFLIIVVTIAIHHARVYFLSEKGYSIICREGRGRGGRERGWERQEEVFFFIIERFFLEMAASFLKSV